jgi:hypothetical protein
VRSLSYRVQPSRCRGAICEPLLVYGIDGVVTL